jgi:hypothetical protein
MNASHQHIDNVTMEVYNKEDVIAHLNTILPQGYTLETDENAFYFIKSETDRKIGISVLMNEYFPHDVTYISIYLNVHFNQVEQIFNNVYVNHPNVDFGHDLNFNKTFGEGFYNTLTENEKYVLENTQVYNDSTFLRVKPVLQKMIDAVLSFLNQHTTLQSYYNLGETMPIAEQADFYGQPLTARKMISKKLLNISDYSTYATTVIANANQRGDSIRANFLQDLKNYLDNM